jgi:hypothetical protein
MKRELVSDRFQDLQEQLLEQAALLGLGENLYSIYAGLNGRHDLLNSVDPEISEFEYDGGEWNCEILLPLMHSQSDGTNYIYCVLAHILRTRGINPIIPLCYQDLPLCHKKTNHRDGVGTCAFCHNDSLTWFDAFGIDFIHLTELISDDRTIEHNFDENGIKNFKYKNIDVSNYAMGSTREYLRRYHVNLDNDRDRDVYVRFLNTAILLVDLTDKLIEERNIEAVLAHHPAYVYGGVPLATAAARGISSVSFGAGYYRQGTILFGNQKNRQGFPQFSSEKNVNKRLKEPLTPGEREYVDEIMIGRKSGKLVRDNSYPLNNANRGINIPDDMLNIGLFTNLLWDGSLSDCDILFEDPFDWVKTTIREISDLSDVNLIIKPHPAELYSRTEEKMAQWIRSNIDTTPNNIILLEADTDIDPYILMNEINYGIIYTSTIGLEMAYEGLPVIVAGDTHFRELGFTYDPEDIDEYVRLLNEEKQLKMNELMKKRARRYAYYLFAERLIDIPFMKEDKIKNCTVTHNELLPGNSKIDKIVDGILSDEKSMIV